MGIKEKLTKLFIGDEEVDVSRRKFIRDAGALAALAVVATKMPTALQVKTLREQLASGLIQDQTFYLTESIVIDLPNVMIRNCTFIAQNPMDYMIELRSDHTMLYGCYLNANGLSKGGVYVTGNNHFMTDCCFRDFREVGLTFNGQTLEGGSVSSHNLGVKSHKISAPLPEINSIKLLHPSNPCA